MYQNDPSAMHQNDPPATLYVPKRHPSPILHQNEPFVLKCTKTTCSPAKQEAALNVMISFLFFSGATRQNPKYLVFESISPLKS